MSGATLDRRARSTGPADDETPREPPTVLVRLDAADPSRRRRLWARRVAAWTGARHTLASRFASTSELLDVAAKREMRWIVSGLAGEAGATTTPAIDGDLGLLVRRAPGPVLIVQPWAPAPPPAAAAAVVGVDRSDESRAAAWAVARLLTPSGAGGGRARLILAHGCTQHPAELAVHTKWSRLVDVMRVERHPWMTALARELRAPGLDVDLVARPRWAPELISGLARRMDATLVGLGASSRVEGRRARVGHIHRHILLGTPCPVLIATPAARARGR